MLITYLPDRSAIYLSMLKNYSIIFFAFLIGCNLNIQAQTYKDIAPIVYTNCGGCHHNGGISFPLVSYYHLSSMGVPVKYAIEQNNMPPWPANPSYRHYHKERVLSASDKNSLLTWINNGMPAGDTTQAPPPPNYSQYQLHGTPDLIVTIPKFTSTAVGSDHYYCINVPTGLIQDRYIRAFEFVPANATIIHHAVITIDTTNTATNDMSGGCYNFQGQINIGDYAPGMGPTVLPAVSPVKFGFKLKANSQISFQIHVPAGSAGQTDSSQLRLYFYPVNEPNVRDMYFTTALQHWNFYIPANDSATVTQRYPGVAGLPSDISLFSLFPHSHQTCKSIINFAYKNADTIPLIDIPRWDFHWQGQYILKNLLKIPATYRIFSKHVFDNTILNPNTPNHNLPVYPGTDTDDEMFFDSFIYAKYITGDETYNIDSLLMADPIWGPTAVNAIYPAFYSVSVFPNPANQIVNFEYFLTQANMTTLDIYTLSGVRVSQIHRGIEPMGHRHHTWSIPSQITHGTYVYKLSAGKSIKSGKIIIQ